MSPSGSGGDLFSLTGLVVVESSAGVFSFIGLGVVGSNEVSASMGLDTSSSVLVSFGVLMSIAAGAVSSLVFAMAVLRSRMPGHPVS